MSPTFGTIDTRVPVDFNDQAPDGSIRVNARRLGLQLTPQTLVAVIDVQDEVEGIALVVRVVEETGLAYLRVRPESVRDSLSSFVRSTVPSSSSKPFGGTRSGRRSARHLVYAGI